MNQHNEDYWVGVGMGQSAAFTAIFAIGYWLGGRLFGWVDGSTVCFALGTAAALLAGAGFYTSWKAK